ncbi:MAG TPA: response regulator [Thermoanaerobaculia bacterium]|jgi:DNA-binding response OmpR family regulator|nr:response regulator [Thermoanaerobaculia bacterium]
MAECNDSRKRLLVVDDSNLVRKLTKVTMEEAGYHVTTAADGLAGLTLGLSEPFDVVVVDGTLPGISGGELCRRLSVLPPESKPYVILHTGTLRGWQARQEALSAGADAYLLKMAGGENLLAMVQDVMEARGAPRRAEVA